MLLCLEPVHRKYGRFAIQIIYHKINTWKDMRIENRKSHAIALHIHTWHSIVYIWVWMCMRMYMYLCLYMCMYMCMSMYTYMYILLAFKLMLVMRRSTMDDGKFHLYYIFIDIVYKTNGTASGSQIGYHFDLWGNLDMNGKKYYFISFTLIAYS